MLTQEQICEFEYTLRWQKIILKCYRLHNCFIDYFDNELFSDIEFTFDCGSNLKASKIILVSRSEYFKTMFNGKWKESKESKIHIKDTKYKIFRYLLKYLYTNELDEGLSLELKDLCI